MKAKSKIADQKTTIRNIDPDLYQQAHIAAIKAKQTVGQFINSAISDKLSKRPGK